MVGWDFFKLAYTKFLGSTDQSTVLSMGGCLLLRSGIDHSSYNFFIVDNYISEIQRALFNESFDCNGLVCSFTDSRDYVQTWSPRLRLMGSPLLVTAQPHDIRNIEVDKSIVVKSAHDTSVLRDHVSIMEEVRGMRGYARLIQKIQEPLHIYVGYIDGKPAGTGSAIQIDNSIFILDVVTREMYKNTGVLSAIGQVSVENANASGISSYSAIVTSGYSQKVANAMGFKVEQVFDMWKVSK